MKSSILPILNAVGCAALIGLAVVQWRKELGLAETISRSKAELLAAQNQYAGEFAKTSALERDVAQLKESIESTRLAAQKAEEDAARVIAERDTLATGFAAAAAEKTKAWETAVAERDEKLKALNAELIATRRRLDDAVEKLKAAGAR